MNQSASGQHEHGDGGHGHGCLGAEGEDSVVPPLAVLLLPGMTLLMGVVSVISRLNRVSSFLPKIFSVHRARERVYLSAWLTFGLFTLNLGYFATYPNHELKHLFCSRLRSRHLVAELLIGTDSLLNDQEMNTELPTMPETPELQIFRSLYWTPSYHTS